MRAALRIVFSRYGIVVIILLLVVGVIALTQGREDFPLGSNDADEGSASSDPSQELTVDDGITAPECEGAECEEDGSPLHDPFEDVELPDEAVGKALDFAEAWVDTEGKSSNAWFQGMQPYMTEEAAELMRGVDPIAVPATEIIGEAKIDGGEVRIPMDTGILVLPMKEGGNDWTDRGWLVSAIDWEPA